jgi:hypothetical protein
LIQQNIEAISEPVFLLCVVGLLSGCTAVECERFASLIEALISQKRNRFRARSSPVGE